MKKEKLGKVIGIIIGIIGILMIGFYVINIKQNHYSFLMIKNLFNFQEPYFNIIEINNDEPINSNNNGKLVVFFGKIDTSNYILDLKSPVNGIYLHGYEEKYNENGIWKKTGSTWGWGSISVNDNQVKIGPFTFTYDSSDFDYHFELYTISKNEECDKYCIDHHQALVDEVDYNDIQNINVFDIFNMIKPS